MNKISIYTDGSCLGNPGPGGWGVVVLINDKIHELSGLEEKTTNNRMEMAAIIEALTWIKKNIPESKIPDIEIEIFSDSNLIIQTLNKGWKKKSNTDLWAKIDSLRGWLNIKWTWVKAHDIDKYNNQADSLAFNAAQNAKKQFSKS